jgi:hypothetical protein
VARALPRPAARVAPRESRRISSREPSHSVPRGSTRPVPDEAPHTRATAAIGARLPARSRSHPLLPIPAREPAHPLPHSNPYLEVPPLSEALASRAYRTANLSDDEVVAELQRRHIGFTPATPPLAGVRTPIKLTGRLHGVWIHSILPPDQAAKTPYEILDARLALALDDFCALLARHDVVEVVHFTMYRASGGAESDANGMFRHPGGLAIDVGAMKKRDGRWLAVGPHWSAAVGAKTCGPGGRTLVNPRGRELMSIVCEASDQRIFTYMLSPHFNAAHADHLHLEIKPGVKWFLVN